MLSARENYCLDQVTFSGAEPSHPTTLKVEKTEWKEPSLLSLRRLGRLGKQLELNGLDATLKQFIASSILNRSPRILSLDASLMPTSSSLIAGFKDIDDDSVSPTVVGLRQANSL
jgi:hypothetical protein